MNPATNCKLAFTSLFRPSLPYGRPRISWPQLVPFSFYSVCGDANWYDSLGLCQASRVLPRKILYPAWWLWALTRSGLHPIYLSSLDANVPQSILGAEFLTTSLLTCNKMKEHESRDTCLNTTKVISSASWRFSIQSLSASHLGGVSSESVRPTSPSPNLMRFRWAIFVSLRLHSPTVFPGLSLPDPNSIFLIGCLVAFQLSYPMSSSTLWNREIS